MKGAFTTVFVIGLMFLVSACGGGVDIYQAPDKDVDFGKWDAIQPPDDPGTVLPDVPLPEAAVDLPYQDSFNAMDEGSPDPGPPDLGWDLSDVWGSDIPYTGIYSGMGELEGQNLVSKLCPLVKNGYDGTGYDNAKDLSLDFVDNYNGKVRAVYKGDWVSGGKGLNHEHTWPQSKGAGTGDAKSDLFHLFPAHPTFNSARGNLPFGWVAIKDWPSGYDGDPDCIDFFPGHPMGCYSIRGWDSQGVKVFEPRDGQKGNSARAILYFALRYGSNCKVKPLSHFDSLHPFVTESLLKTWNAMDPPDGNERTRNDRIETIQKVRNPFVDHPEFVDRITFQ